MKPSLYEIPPRYLNLTYRRKNVLDMINMSINLLRKRITARMKHYLGVT